MKKVINIFGDITSQPYFKEDASALKMSEIIDGATSNDEIEININTYGGEVFEAVAMRSLLTACPSKKIFNILGICASAGTILFNKDDEVNVNDGAFTMYHPPMGGAFGNVTEMQRVINLLNKIEAEHVIKNLIGRTGKTGEELTNLIKNEWWLSSDEAIQDLGFIATKKAAIENTAKTKQENIYKNYISRKKALNSNVYNRYINLKNSLK